MGAIQRLYDKKCDLADYYGSDKICLHLAENIAELLSRCTKDALAAAYVWIDCLCIAFDIEEAVASESERKMERQCRRILSERYASGIDEMELNLYKNWNNRQRLEAVADYYGAQLQLFKLFEESGELLTLLGRMLVGGDVAEDDLISEIADVYNMMDQIEILSDVEDEIEEKIEDEIDGLYEMMIDEIHVMEELQ